jgi:hypothetical protein
MPNLRKTVSNTNVSYRKKVQALGAVLLLLLFSYRLLGQSSREYNIKAAFLYNFSQFVEWPAGSFDVANGPFIIGILGEDPFRTSLDEAVAGEKVKGHPIIVQRFLNISEINNCKILFISRSETAKVREILPALQNRNILTVSDIPEFATIGGIIRFLTIQNKIKLQINIPASKAAELNISSKLLQVAEIVR